MTMYATHCEEMVDDVGILFRACRGRGLHVCIHPGGAENGTKVLCTQHSRKAFMSGWRVDWDETARVFGTKRPQDPVRTRI